MRVQNRKNGATCSNAGSNTLPTELTCFPFTVHAGRLYVSVTHRTLTWASGSFKCAQVLNACVHTHWTLVYALIRKSAQSH